METVEQIKARLEAAVPGLQLQVLVNPSPCQQSSLLVDSKHMLEVARILRDDPQLRLDFCSSVAGVDYLDQTLPKSIRTKVVVNGVETEMEEAVAHTKPGFLEVVYHLYSMALKQGPVIIRQRTLNRTDRLQLPLFDSALARLRTPGARGFRSLRGGLRRTPRPAPRLHVGYLQRSSHAQRLHGPG